jgi:hypothetical protein
MLVAMASSAGHARPNEDFVGAAPGAVVLVDGAGIPGSEALCRHGTAWYAHTLGATLLGVLSRTPEVSLVSALADSIERVAAQHRDSCDLLDPNSPQASVAIVRIAGDRVDHLVLGDIFVVLTDHAADLQVITDARQVEVRDECSAPLQGLAPGSPEYEQLLPGVVDDFRARRNQPGGYWIAKDDPAVASHAVTGSGSLAEVKGAALLSNGASRFVDPYRLGTWGDVIGLLRTRGPDELLSQVRGVEAAASGAGAPPQAASPDDASVAYFELAREKRTAPSTM